MELVLVNAPDLSIITPTVPPSPTVVSKYFSFVIPITTVISVTAQITTDLNMSVDNMNVVTKIIFTIKGTMQVGQQTLDVTGTITMNGNSVFTTENNQSLILFGNMATGTIMVQGTPIVASATVISCGQTSTMVD